MLKLSIILSKELCKKSVDWDNVRSILQDNKDIINDYDEKDRECVLSDLYGYPGSCGANALRLTKLFLDVGFDVSANNGMNGGSCLDSICWRLYDKFILDIAELLLDSGADPHIDMDEEEDKDSPLIGILNTIDWQLGNWTVGDCDYANMFEAYYLMAERALNGKEYRGIRAFRDSVGLEVEKIELIKKKHTRANGDEVRNGVLITCGGKILEIVDYVELMLNPYAYEDVVEVCDISDKYPEIIGAHIKGLRFQHSSQAKLSFDNGYYNLIWNNSARERELSEEWFSLAKDQRSEFPGPGTKVERISFVGMTVHSNTIRYYEERMVILRLNDASYSLYTNKIYDEDTTIRFEEQSNNLTENIKRHLGVNNMVIQEVHKKGEAIDWIRISCDEGSLYLSTHFSHIALFLTENEIDNPQNVGSSTKGLIKMSFPGTEIPEELRNNPLFVDIENALDG